ncbi:MAG: EAL domain-containing protein [Proteobacteria bacterium]|nr:bifunctional diguanylate cyclase/phosphodiesterase [Pseudomonadota bacterium]NOG59935.1 EAL domain-containing protein [Pseudomonadota bacterium]
MKNNKKLRFFNLHYFKSIFFLSGLVLALLFWLIDPFIDAVFFEKGTIHEEFFNPGAHEAFMRFFISIVIIIYSFIGSVLLTKSKKLNTALESSEQRYRSLIEATTSIIWTTNEYGEFIVPQTSWENFTGQPWEEHQGFGWTKKIHPDDVEHVKKAWGKACEEKIFYETSGRVWNAGLNDWRDFEVRAVPINNPDGSLREWVGIITDITERKRSEVALINSEQRFRRYFELGLMGMAITSPDKAWLEFNDTLPQMFDYTEEEFRNLSWAELTYPDDLESEVEQFERVLAGEIDGYSMEKRFVHKSGKVIYAIISANAIRNTEGFVDYFVVIIHDISVLKRTEIKLRSSENKYRTLIESSPYCIHQIDMDGLITSMNHSGLKMLNLKEESEIIGVPYLDSINPDDKERVSNLMNYAFTGEAQEFEFTSIGGLDFRSSFVPIYNEDEKVDRLLGITLDITERKIAERQLNFQASHDSLTGLINRQEFERRAERLLSTITITKDEHALCFMDLDQFKVINDTCGHIAGDEMLRQLSAILDSVVRKRDTLARLGGDEFGVLMEHCSIEDAHRVASSLQSAIQDYQFLWEKRIFKVSVSIGLVSINETTISFTELLKDADAACYLSKEAGRNRIHIFNPDDLEAVQRQGEMQWVEEINRALEEDRFCLYIQTIEALDGSSEKHHEFLIRMIDHTGNTVPPGAFLPAAERYNLISKIDRWVIVNAISLLNNNFEYIKNTNSFSINLSGQSLTDPTILNLITTTIDESGIEGNKLCFEITETAAISNLSMAIKFITALKSKGCKFALDDFGSGLSSFGYLKKLPVDYLKIDGMFVKDIADDPIDHAMVKSINEIGHVMGMHTIAEFVENDITKGMLKEIGVDYVQGYGVDKPQPFEKLLTNQ